jgi:RHS repeat-associated protein
LVDAAANNTHVYLYDKNGNVAGLVDATTRKRSATYDYDAFGQLTVSYGTYAKANPFTFSTKHTDYATGLCYYGYRFYDPMTGRWPSRDPAEEKGGLNLYAMLGNRTTNRIDFLGLESCKCGPDISDAFYAYLRYVTSYLKSLPDEVKGPIDGLSKMQDIGGNIDFWYKGGMAGCATGRCKDTVFFAGRCVRSTVINNVLFGAVASAMEIPEGLAGDGANINNIMKGNGFEGREQYGAYSIGYWLWRKLKNEETWADNLNDAAHRAYTPDGPFRKENIDEVSKAFSHCQPCGKTVTFKQMSRVGVGFFMWTDKQGKNPPSR